MKVVELHILYVCVHPYMGHRQMKTQFNIKSGVSIDVILCVYFMSLDGKELSRT